MRKFSDNSGTCCMCKRTDQPVALVPSFRDPRNEYSGNLCALCITECLGQCPSCARMLKRDALECPKCATKIPCKCSRWGWNTDGACLHCGKPKTDNIQYCGVCKQPLIFVGDIELGVHGKCEDRKIYGTDQLVYCGNHLTCHETGFCSANIDMKVGMGTKDGNKARQKCKMLGLKLMN